MSRIRAIKPSFFTNEILAELSPWHRLCFAGLWTQADREGRLEDRPRRLKAALFPYDEIDVDVLLTDLAEKGFILRYDAAGAPAIEVIHFLKHQRPKADEHVSLIAAPLLNEKCLSRAGPRIGNREVGNRELGDRGEEQSAAAFMAAWNAITKPPIPRCRDLTSKRRKHIRSRLSERPLADFEALMARVQASAFCRGEVAARREGEQPWVATIDWFIGSPDVAVKVSEGAYDDRKSARPPPPVEHDWYAECGLLHNHDCELDRYRHINRMQMEKAS